MGQPLAFAESNDVYLPPAGMEDDVEPLKVRKLDGCLVSCWKLSAEELAEVVRTGVIWVVVMGAGLPPLMVLGRKRDAI